MADTIIRQIPDDEMIVLDEIASENGMTRETFLRQKIHEIVRHELRLKQDTSFNEIVGKATEQIKKTEQVFNQFLERYDEN